MTATGVPAGLGPRHTTKTYTPPPPAKLDFAALDSAEIQAGDLLRQAENAVIEAGKAEAEHDALYAQPEQVLAEKY